MLTISFIGSGNLAWHLAPALDNVGFIVKEVYSRNPKHAEALTERLYQAEVKATLDFSTSSSSIFIIAVADDAIKEIAREIILPEEAILVHTSGSQPLSELQFAATTNLGVFYPLQTFTKSKKIDFKSIPVFIESNNEETSLALITLAKAVSNSVKKIGSEERKAMHVAAVFASNFTNHMLTISKDLMENNGLSFDWLKPLVLETINKGLSTNPKQAQTGPAMRGDLEVLDKHLEFLKEDEAVAEIYRLVSQHIIDQHGD
ncbi:MAG TPA: DUF2520 domain-containing protein [Cyclobacteriaceae bacterium]|jgi:predicted short-subunit dehydrogenase-like oxidoreductase (DUF2520 family)|nr:DUF2520 domain-containing protein [Cyclobacteriaceae bacterium]